jgi:hypothetical protein
LRGTSAASVAAHFFSVRLVCVDLLLQNSPLNGSFPEDLVISDKTARECHSVYEINSVQLKSSIKSLLLLFSMGYLVCTMGTGYAASASPANFEQKKAEQLRRLDQRITNLRDERTCIQEATSQDAIKSCREKFKVGNRQGRKQS